MKISHIGVVGAGQMGAGIAQVAAMHGYQVTITDISSVMLERGQQQVSKSVHKLGHAKPLDLHWGTDLNLHQKADLVVEAIVEDESLKKRLFQGLEALVRPEAILASNTSSISITRLASCLKNPARMIGMHFMNPVPIMRLVEVIRGFQTSDEACEIVCGVARSCEKEVTLSKDYPGFIANRILMPMINEAFFALMEGVAQAEDIDKTMKLGANQPMGPLQLADFIGLDTCLAIMKVLHTGLGDSKYRPCPLLVQYVDAGRFGKKVGRGVYAYGV